MILGIDTSNYTTSAAVDGVKTALKIMESFAPPED